MALNDFAWAKSNPRKSLYCHMYEAAVAIRTLLTDSIYAPVLRNLSFWLGLTSEETIRLLMYLAALHDIGKAHPLFQNHRSVPFAIQYFQDHPEYIGNYLMHPDYRHEKGSCTAVWRIWKDNAVFEPKLIKAFANIMTLHHQGKKGNDYCISPNPDWDHPEWQGLQDELERKIRFWINPPMVTGKQIRHMDAACTMITALVIFTDWIISSELLSTYGEPAPEEQIENRVRMFLNAAGLADCNGISEKHIWEIWPWMKAESLRPVQSVLDTYLSQRNEMPTLMILEAPMGEGKTEAGIYAALRMAAYWEKSGLYIGLPTAATSNQMHSRVNALLETHNIGSARLLHSMAWLEDSDDTMVQDADNEYSDWLKPSKRSLLSPWAVGTIDQALMSVLRVKYGVLRLLGLSGKVLVLDEIHAYDAYMSSIIKRLLEWCKALKIPVVMLSATLPEEKRAELLSVYTSDTPAAKGYPQISAVFDDGKLEQIVVDGSYQKQTVSINRIPVSMTEPAEIATYSEKKIVSGGCLCILVNTVKAAQEIYRYLKEKNPEYPLLLFHSRFTAARKKEIEEECIRLFGPDHSNRPDKAILVATQVVEQSLDLDFDAMITEIAPVDLLLQRCGRLHRHKDTLRPAALSEPELGILVPTDREYGAAEMIYYPLLLDRTMDVLQEYPCIHIPQDIPVLVNRVYQMHTMAQDEMEAFLKKQFQEDILTGQAEMVELDPPNARAFQLKNTSAFLEDDDQSVQAKTRFSEETVRIAIVPERLYKQVQDSTGISADLARRVMLYSVTVRKKVLDTFQIACPDNRNPLQGKGKLLGVSLYCAAEESCKPNETCRVCFQEGCILADKEMGMIMKRKGDTE